MIVDDIIGFFASVASDVEILISDADCEEKAEAAGRVAAYIVTLASIISAKIKVLKEKNPGISWKKALRKIGVQVFTSLLTPLYIDVAMFMANSFKLFSALQKTALLSPVDVAEAIARNAVEEGVERTASKIKSSIEFADELAENPTPESYASLAYVGSDVSRFLNGGKSLSKVFKEAVEKIEGEPSSTLDKKRLKRHLKDKFREYYRWAVDAGAVDEFADQLAYILENEPTKAFTDYLYQFRKLVVYSGLTGGELGELMKWSNRMTRDTGKLWYPALSRLYEKDARFTICREARPPPGTWLGVLLEKTPEPFLSKAGEGGKVIVPKPVFEYLVQGEKQLKTLYTLAVEDYGIWRTVGKGLIYTVTQDYLQFKNIPGGEIVEVELTNLNGEKFKGVFRLPVAEAQLDLGNIKEAGFQIEEGQPLHLKITRRVDFQIIAEYVGKKPLAPAKIVTPEKITTASIELISASEEGITLGIADYRITLDRIGIPYDARGLAVAVYKELNNGDQLRIVAGPSYPTELIYNKEYETCRRNFPVKAGGIVEGEGETYLIFKVKHKTGKYTINIYYVAKLEQNKLIPVEDGIEKSRIKTIYILEKYYTKYLTGTQQLNQLLEQIKNKILSHFEEGEKGVYTILDKDVQIYYGRLFKIREGASWWIHPNKPGAGIDKIFGDGTPDQIILRGDTVYIMEVKWSYSNNLNRYAEAATQLNKYINNAINKGYIIEDNGQLIVNPEKAKIFAEWLLNQSFKDPNLNLTPEELAKQLENKKIRLIIVIGDLKPVLENGQPIFYHYQP